MLNSFTQKQTLSTFFKQKLLWSKLWTLGIISFGLCPWSLHSRNIKYEKLIIPILFCYKTLHVSGIFSARHQEFSTVHSTLVSFIRVSDVRFQAESGVVSFMRVSDDRFQADSGWNILTVLGSGHQKPAWNLPVSNVQ